MTLAVWDKNTDPKRQAEDLVGYCKVGLQSGYTTFGQISQDKIAEVIRRQGDSLIEIAGGPIPVRGIAMNDERGILNVSASIGSVRQIKAAIEDNDYDQYGRDKYQRVKRKNTFDSREDEEVNETASDKDLPQGDVSSDESAKLRREIRGKKTKKKQELRNLKRNAKKRFIKEESEQEEDDETDQENDEEEKSEPEVHSKRSNHPPKNPTKLNNEPSKSKGEKRTKNDQSNKKLLTLKDNSLARQLDEPSEKNQSVNEAKIVLKADDNDLVHDKKTGKSYQKLPGGGVAELKKMSMRNVDGTLETVYINPKAETSIGKKSNLSKEDYNELKAREQSVKRPSESSNPTIIHKSRKEISQKNEPFKAPKSQNNLTSVASRISLPKSVRKSSRSQFDIQEEESSKESRQISAHKTKHRRPFEFEEGDSDEGEEEYSEDSEEEAIQIRIADKSKSKSFKEVSKPLNSLGDSRGLKHSKTKSQILPNQSIMSRSELNTPLLPHKSGGGLITQKSEVESNDDEDDESNEEKPNGFYDENSVIGKPKFMVGGMSTILQPRVSKLENAKNLKVPVKVGTSSRNNEAYTPRSNIASKFSFPDKNKKSDIDHSVVSRKSSRPKLNLPIGVIDSKPDTESPTPIDIEKFSLNELDKNANESPSMFFMDKKQVKRVGEHSYKGPGNMNKPSARTRLQEYTEETSDPRKRDEVPQFETILPKDFFCDDLIMSFTMILEYFRRFIFMHTALSERMDNLYLGQYQQQMAESISFIDLEYIMEHYNVFITKTELEGLFDFLDEDDKGEISLADLHESLLAYLQFYETITFELYQGIKLLHKAIKQRISLEEFKDYVVDNSERYHIRREHLIDYIENFLELNNPLVNQTMATCGEFIYFDSCYYFNILNYLLFVEHFVGDTLSFEYVNSLHHYHKFKSLIEVKLVYQMYEVFKIPNPDPESLREALQARYNKISDRLPHKVNFRQFRQLLKEMKLTEITVWESMILFKQALESTQSLTNVGFTKHSLLNRGEAFKLLESLATSKRSGDQQTEQSQITHSLLIDKIKKQKNQVAGEKFVYRYDIAVENVDDLNIARCDYCDLSVMYQFPGEAEAIESQIFTYIPDEHSYNVGLSSTHTYTLLKKKGLVELFGKTNGLRVILTKQSKKVKEGIGLATIPVDDLINPGCETRQYFLYPLKQDITKQEYLGVLTISLSAAVAKEDLYINDILANQDGDKAVEAITDIDRGLPTEGVMTMYVESMSNLSGVYSALEGIVRDAFNPNIIAANCRFKIALYLEITDLILKENDEEPSRANFIEPFTIELDHQNVESKVQCFRFIEKHISRNHIINNWKHVPLKFDEEKFSALSDCQLSVSLYLECAPEFSGGNLSRRRCGRVFIPLDSILSASNQDGYKASYGLVSDSRDIVAYLNCTLNYSKSAHERGNQIVEELKTDMIQRAENLKHNKVYIRICELLFLKPADSLLRKGSFKVASTPLNLRLRLLLGNSEIKSVEIAVPSKLGELFRLKFDGHERADQFVEILDLSDIEKYITDKSTLEKYFNVRTSTQTFHSLPPFIIEVSHFEDYTVLQEVGRFEFNLIGLLSQQGKWENRGLLNYRAYLPLLPRAGKEGTIPIESARLGVDFTILKANKIKNRHTLEDIGRLLLDSKLRSLKQVESWLISSPSTSQLSIPISFDVAAVTRLLKNEFSLANTEIAEIIDLLGKTPEESEVDFYKVVTSPFMNDLSMLNEDNGAVKLILEEILRVNLV